MRLLLLAAFVFQFAQAQARPLVRYIYIEASEGNASGGHAALQLGETVFHYQYEEGLIRLSKQDVNDFEYVYRFCGNRSLHTNQIKVTEKDYARLWAYFNQHYQIQQQQFNLLHQINNERRFLEALLHPEVGRLTGLPAAGLFYRDTGFVNSPAHGQKSELMLALRQAMESVYGRDFLKRKKAQIARQLNALSLVSWPPLKNITGAGRFPPLVYSLSERYMDLVSARLALNVLAQGLAIRDQVMVDGPHVSFRLAEPELAGLRRYSKHLRTSLLKLVDSSRPDWGRALLINMARWLTIERSIRQGRLMFVNTFDDSVQMIPEAEARQYHAQLHQHWQDTQRRFLQAKGLLTQAATLTEMQYSTLEMLANRYMQLFRAEQGLAALRFDMAGLVPGKTIALPLLWLPALSQKEIKQAWQDLAVYQMRYQNMLEQLYAYNLLNRNCVTELLDAMQQALEPEKGDTPIVMPDRVFVPLLSHYALSHYYTVTEDMSLPAFRLMKLNEAYGEENALWVYLRENNTLTSTTYRYNEEDSFFIFFTDDTVLLRPVYGAVNTLAGFGQTLLGLMSWPFDNGQMLHSGGRGVLMSLPELLFVNMRKGSFKYLPYEDLLDAKQTLAYR